MTQQQLTLFYSRVSFSGKLALYAIKLSLENHMAFDREDLGSHISILKPDYFHGFTVALVAFNLVQYNVKGNVHTITYLDPLISQTIVAEVEKTSLKFESWKSALIKVKEYFK